jgi:hypothetical protein
MSVAWFAAAIVASVALVLSSPIIGQLRAMVRASFPGRFVVIVGSIIGVAIGIALLAALFRIRDRRLPRYASIALALAIGAGYSLVTATPDPQVNAVERFHFVEYGLVTFLFYRAWRPLDDAGGLVLPLLAGLLVGTLDEWFQWFVPVRIGDVRDVFLNAVALTCGLLFSVGVYPPGGRVFARLRPESLRHLRGSAVILLLAFACFFQFAHLGYEIRDPEAGVFRSRYDLQTLYAIAQDRRARWLRDPLPLRIPRFSQEDQYMTEGVLHVQERNQRWSDGDPVSAWHENVILEKFYGPVLDTPSYVSPVGHRWPAPQRAAAHARVASAAVAHRPYVSRADHDVLRTWPKSLFWTVIGLAAVGVIAVTSMVERRRARRRREG